MKLDLCLVACDLNDNYTQFFDIVKFSWKHYVGIDTKFILISSFIPTELESFTNDIILFNPIEDIPTAFQAQCIRILYPALLTEYKNSIIISDMDLIPLNKSYYVDSIDSINEDNFVVYRNIISEYLQYPICFCTAKPNIWAEIFSINSINDICNTIETWYELFVNAGHFYQISSPFSVIWACDQLKLFELINKWNKKVNRLTLLSDQETKFNRLDRLNILHIENNLHQYQVEIRSGIYSDFHLPRLKSNQDSIKKLIKKLNF